MDSHNDGRRPRLAAKAGRRVDNARCTNEPTAEVAAEAWRRERLYLYLYWLANRDRSPFNFVGSWHTADLGDEAARWQEALRGLERDAALELVERELALRFGKPWQQAQLEGASPRLAAQNLPVWNAATASLLPAHLGPLALFGAESYTAKPTLGWSYNYGRAGSSEKLSLTLCTGGQVDLRDVPGEPWIREQFDAAWLRVCCKVEAGGGRILEGTVRGPAEDVLLDRYNRKVAFLAMDGQAVDSDQVARFEALCMCGFRDHILKVRYTRRAAPGEVRTVASGLDTVKADLADFVASYR